MCVSSLSYPACKAHAPYSRLWPFWLYHISPHYLVNGTIFGKRLLEVKCVLLFSLQLLCATFFILRRTRFDFIYLYIYIYIYIDRHVKYALFLWDFNQTWIFSAYLWKILTLHWSPSCEEPRCYKTAGGRAEKHDKANSRFSELLERALKPSIFPAMCVCCVCCSSIISSTSSSPVRLCNDGVAVFSELGTEFFECYLNIRIKMFNSRGCFLNHLSVFAKSSVCVGNNLTV